MSIDDEPVTTLDDLKGDLARRYTWTPSSGASVDSAIVDADMVALDRDGYVIWENLLGADECQQIRDTVGPWIGAKVSSWAASGEDWAEITSAVSASARQRDIPTGAPERLLSGLLLPTG